MSSHNRLYAARFQLSQFPLWKHFFPFSDFEIKLATQRSKLLWCQGVAIFIFNLIYTKIVTVHIPWITLKRSAICKSSLVIMKKYAKLKNSHWKICHYSCCKPPLPCYRASDLSAEILQLSDFHTAQQHYDSSKAAFPSITAVLMNLFERVMEKIICSWKFNWKTVGKLNFHHHDMSNNAIALAEFSTLFHIHCTSIYKLTSTD